VAIIVLAGCATVQPDARFPDVQRSVEERLGHNVAWNRGREPDAATSARVAALLAEPCTVVVAGRAS
jgi:cobalt-zinc-cadmium efflux system outer membrane protein